MAIPRPLLLALLGAVLAAVAFYATRGGASETTSTSTPPPAAPAPERPLKSMSPSKDGTAGGKSAPPALESEGARKSGADKTDPSHTPAKPKAKSKPAATPGVPPRVGRALAKKQVVVIFFRQRGADDAATAKAVAGVRARRGVAVFTDSIGRLKRYPRLVGGLGISQAPSVVVVGRSRKATLLEGYTDPGTLKQQVLDAR